MDYRLYATEFLVAKVKERIPKNNRRNADIKNYIKLNIKLTSKYKYKTNINIYKTYFYTDP